MITKIINISQKHILQISNDSDNKIELLPEGGKMKFCTHCGKEIQDNSRFCTGCGQPIKESSGSKMTNDNILVENQRKHIASDFTSGFVIYNPAQKAIQSTLYLVAVIANSIYLGLNLLSILFSDSSSAMNSYIRQLQSVLGYSYFSYFNMVNGAIKMVSVLFMIPPIIFCIGLWLIYSSVSGKTGNKTTGFSMARIILIIQLVGYVILFAILLLTGIFAGFASGEIGVVLLIIVMVGGLGALILLFYLKALSSLQTIQDNVMNGSTGTLSLYVPIIGFIAGIVSFFTLFSVSGFIAIISSLARIVWIVTASIWMIQYKNYR